MSASTTAFSELQSSLRELSIGDNGPIKDVARPTTTSASLISESKPRNELVAESLEEQNLVSELNGENPLSQETKDRDGKHKQQGQQQQQQQSQARSSSNNHGLPLSPSLNAEGPLEPPPTPISPQTLQFLVPAGAPDTDSASCTSPSSSPSVARK